MSWMNTRITPSLRYEILYDSILLPSDHCLTRLAVLQSHDQVMHSRVRETLTQVRAKYWITKGRQVIRKILSKCTICRRLEGPPLWKPRSTTISRVPTK